MNVVIESRVYGYPGPITRLQSHVYAVAFVDNDGTAHALPWGMIPKQFPIPGGYVSLSEQTIGGRPNGRYTAMIVLGGSVVHSVEDQSASKAVAAASTWLHGLTSAVSEIATKLRRAPS